MIKIKSIFISLLSKLKPFKSTLILRAIVFLNAIIVISALISLIKNSYPLLQEKTANTNLGILLNALQNNSLISLLVAFIIVGFIFSIIALLCSFTNLIHNKIIIKLYFICFVGVLPITFLFTLVLMSTKPSDTTLIFSILSAIGASITFCFTMYNSLKK